MYGGLEILPTKRVVSPKGWCHQKGGVTKRVVAHGNGLTDNHLGVEWLKRVYLPQTTPVDPSDARLIILDGHGSHATVRF